MPHFPVTPAPEFDGKAGNGFSADALAQMDSYAGELLDTVDKLGNKDNTNLVWFKVAVSWGTKQESPLEAF
jgi:hypothetical protein